MPSLAELLRRFRYGGVPGAPASIGVPPDRRPELETELGPVLELLAESDRQANELVGAAERLAAERRAEAELESRRIIGDAEREAEAVRAAASQERLARAAAEKQSLIAAATAEAIRVDALSAARVPDLAKDVVQRVLATDRPESLPAQESDPPSADG